jgi:myo-inositol-1(or 4)-monophosphatase
VTEACRPGWPTADAEQLEELLGLAVDLACAAGQLQEQRLWQARQVETKSSASDLVTDVDRACERLIVGRLRESRPDDSVVAEEGTLWEAKTGVRWVIDPLDGTTNYVYGYPAFAVSIAVEIDGRARIGVVFDSSSGHCYRAVEGWGAFCDEQPIRARHLGDLPHAVLGTGFSYDPEQRERQGRVLTAMLSRVSDIRRSGSASLDLCHVAAGHLDGFFELDLALWDYAAGAVIAREAGAEVAFPESAHGLGPAVVVANGSLMAPLLGLLAEAGALAPGTY